MATEVHQFTCTIPANTPKTTPHTVTIKLDYRLIERIDLDVPPGPAYLMGFFLEHSGTQMIPLELGEFIVWDDYKESWPLDELPTSEGWAVVGWNLDNVNDHAVGVRFHTSSVPIVSTYIPSITIVSQPALEPVLLP